jgi:protein-tyrosine phosphatase
VGLRDNSERKISDKDVLWADIILAMEDVHKKWIMGLFKHITLPPIEVINIPDDYEYMDSELVDHLKDRINDTLRIKFEI